MMGLPLQQLMAIFASYPAEQRRIRDGEGTITFQPVLAVREFNKDAALAEVWGRDKGGCLSWKRMLRASGLDIQMVLERLSDWKKSPLHHKVFKGYLVGALVRLWMDTGANITLVGASFLKEHPHLMLLPVLPTDRFEGLGGSALGFRGTVQFSVVIGSVVVEVIAAVLAGELPIGCTILLGNYDLDNPHNKLTYIKAPGKPLILTQEGGGIAYAEGGGGGNQALVVGPSSCDSLLLTVDGAVGLLPGGAVELNGRDVILSDTICLRGTGHFLVHAAMRSFQSSEEVWQQRLCQPFQDSGLPVGVRVREDHIAYMIDPCDGGVVMEIIKHSMDTVYLRAGLKLGVVLPELYGSPIDVETDGLFITPSSAIPVCPQTPATSIYWICGARGEGHDAKCGGVNQGLTNSCQRCGVAFLATESWRLDENTHWVCPSEEMDGTSCCTVNPRHLNKCQWCEGLQPPWVDIKHPQCVGGLLGSVETDITESPAMLIAKDPVLRKQCRSGALTFYNKFRRMQPNKRKEVLAQAKVKEKASKEYIKPKVALASELVASTGDIPYQPLAREENANDERHDGEEINSWTHRASISAPLSQVEEVPLTDEEFLLIMGALNFCDATGAWLGNKRRLFIVAITDLLVFRRAGIFRLNYNEGLTKVRGVQYDVQLQPGMESNPVNMGERRYSEAERMEICTQVLQLLKAGILSPVRSAWSNGLVMVAKAGGGIRMCVDFRELNKRTVALAGTLPLIQDVIAESFRNDHLLFSHMDLSQAYHQLEVTAASQQYLAFKVPRMPTSLLAATTERPPFQVCFTRLPFGLTDAVTAFSNITQDIFRPAGIPTYLDDLAFGTIDVEEHVLKVRQIMLLAVTHGLTFGLKCELYRTEIACLGYVVNAAGVSLDPERVQGLLNMEEPKSLSEVQTYIGMVQFCAGFLGMEYATVLAPLTDLTRKENGPFEWGEEQREAIKKLKQLLTSSQCLKIFDNSLPTMIVTDGSKRGVGAALLQQHGDQWFPVFYLSKKLSPVQGRWATSQYELFALILAVDRWRQFLVDKPFVVLTDHQALTYLRSPRLFTGRRLTRWQMLLSEFNFFIRHKPGADNGLADCLSRMVQAQGDPIREAGDVDAETELISLISSLAPTQSYNAQPRAAVPVCHVQGVAMQVQSIGVQATQPLFTPGQTVLVKRSEWGERYGAGDSLEGVVRSRVLKGVPNNERYYSVWFNEVKSKWTVKETAMVLKILSEEETLNQLITDEKQATEPGVTIDLEKGVEAVEALELGDLVYVSINHERLFLPSDKVLRPLGYITSIGVDTRVTVQLLARHGDTMVCDARNVELMASRRDILAASSNTNATFGQGDVVYIPNVGVVAEIVRVLALQGVALDRCEYKDRLVGVVQRCVTKNEYEVHFGGFEAGVYTLSPKQMILVRQSVAVEMRERLLGASPYVFSEKEKSVLVAGDMEKLTTDLTTLWSIQLAEAIRVDPLYGLIVAWLEGRDDDTFVPSTLLEEGVNYADRYKLEGDLLFIKMREVWQVVIPRALEETIVRLAHDGQDHFDATRTQHFVSQYFYFEHIAEKVQRFVGSCKTCQCRRNRQFYRDEYGPYIADIMNYTTVGRDWAIDLKKEAKDAAGFIYILVMVDLYSKYVVTVPLRSKEKEEVVAAIYEHLIAKFGHGLSILADKGSEFINDYGEMIYSKFNIQTHYISERNPQGNGCCERFNRTFNDHLAKGMASGVLGHDVWSTWLIHMTSVYNASYHVELAQSPFYLMFGREFDLQLCHGTLPEGIQMTKKRQRNGRTIAEVSAVVDAQLREIFRIREERYHKQRQAHEVKTVLGQYGCLPNFSTGALVLVHLGNSNGGHSAKSRCHAGPFEVVDRLSNSSYLIKGADGQPVVVHAAKLLKYVFTYADMVGSGRLASSAVGAAESRLLNFRDTEVVERKE